MRTLVFLALLGAMGRAEIIDRMAIVVNKHVIKDSDIDRDVRLTEYLNGETPSLTPDIRKKAAQRLIDQQIIRREVETGNYPLASTEEVDKFLEEVHKQRPAMSSYRLTERELRAQLLWQLTVLYFIEQRFRPSVMVTEDEINDYLKTHAKETHQQAEEMLAGERVNQAFETWLDRARQRAKVEYRETELQ